MWNNIYTKHTEKREAFSLIAIEGRNIFCDNLFPGNLHLANILKFSAFFAFGFFLSSPKLVSTAWKHPWTFSAELWVASSRLGTRSWLEWQQGRTPGCRRRQNLKKQRKKIPKISPSCIFIHHHKKANVLGSSTSSVLRSLILLSSISNFWKRLYKKELTDSSLQLLLFVTSIEERVMLIVFFFSFIFCYYPYNLKVRTSWARPGQESLDFTAWWRLFPIKPLSSFPFL